jgi:hypothetical protein
MAGIPRAVRDYVAKGYDLSKFSAWVENFRGSARSEDDIKEYILGQYGIVVESLEAEMERASLEFRSAVQEVWQRAHDSRRGADSSLNLGVHQLVQHDVENYVGVIERRRREANSELGYSTWWLTNDRSAFSMRSRLREYYEGQIPSSPVMGLGFLSNWIAIGPMRSKLSDDAHFALPVMVDSGLINEMTPELIAAADRVRLESQQLPDHIVRRRIRDRLDSLRGRQESVSELDDLAEERAEIASQLVAPGVGSAPTSRSS